MVVYLADVLIYPGTRGGRPRRLSHVSRKAEERQLFLRLPKRDIVTQRVNYLGFGFQDADGIGGSGEGKGPKGMAGGVAHASTSEVS